MRAGEKVDAKVVQLAVQLDLSLVASLDSLSEILLAETLVHLSGLCLAAPWVLGLARPSSGQLVMPKAIASAVATEWPW